MLQTQGEQASNWPKSRQEWRGRGLAAGGGGLGLGGNGRIGWELCWKGEGGERRSRSLELLKAWGAGLATGDWASLTTTDWETGTGRLERGKARRSRLRTAR